MSRWFRMHDELLDDPKVQRLPAADFKGWVNLLCLASKNNGKLPSVADIAFALRETEDAVTTLLARLLDGGLIVSRSGGADGMHYAPYKWEERQYKSDTSTDRVKRCRERSKAVAETPPDTEADTDTEETPLSPPLGGRRGKTLIPSDWQLPKVSDLPPRAKACAEQWTDASYQTEGEAYVCYWRSERKMKADWDGTWANRVIARHSAVMRDQKFGNAAPTASLSAASDPATVAANKRRLADHYDREGKTGEAAELRREAAALEQRIAA